MSLVGALAAVAGRRSGHGLRIFGDEQEIERVSFDQLYAEAGQVACGLLERGVRPGERVAIAVPTSVDFARAFFGVLAAGAVPVPVPPPLRFGSLELYLHRITLALRHSRVTWVLSNRTLTAMILDGVHGEFRVLDVAAARGASAMYAEVADDDPAVVQYTSGTSAVPKGVVLSHANMLANVKAITTGLAVTGDDVSCNWLPMFHDMGLVGAFLASIFNDLETILLPPEDFIRDPGRWVRMISRFAVSITVAPNSGYLHTLRKVPADRVPELDLSSWRLAPNGAETVDIAMQRQFCAHFAPAGFRPTAFLPVYGLAEATLAVTFPPVDRPAKTISLRRDLLGAGVVAFAPEGAEQARELVSVGSPVAGTEIRLVGQDGAAQPAYAGFGEIQIRGESVMRCYEADEEATRTTVHDGGWVSTGDLGLLHENELFIVGRKKEVVVVFGENYYVGDVESIAGGVPGTGIHGVLAAGIPFPEGEALVLFVETTETKPAARSELVASIRYAVSSALGVSPREVILIRKGQLPRTSSGKLQRHGLETLYQKWTSPVLSAN